MWMIWAVAHAEPLPPVRVRWEVPKEGASGWVELVEMRDNVWTVTDAESVEH